MHIKIKTPPCTDPKNLGILVDEYLAGELDEASKSMMMQHIECCPCCKETYDKWEALKLVMQSWNPHPTPPQLHTDPSRIAAWTDILPYEEEHIWKCPKCYPHVPRAKKFGYWMGKHWFALLISILSLLFSSLFLLSKLN